MQMYIASSESDSIVPINRSGFAALDKAYLHPHNETIELMHCFIVMSQFAEAVSYCRNYTTRIDTNTWRGELSVNDKVDSCVGCESSGLQQ